MRFFKTTGSQAEDSMTSAFATFALVGIGAIVVVAAILFYCMRAVIHHFAH